MIPLMAVQHTKGKVHPVMELQGAQRASVDADVCTVKLREWHQQGGNMELPDLRRAYLQVQVHESHWAYQTVTDQGGEILPHVVGLRVKCGANDHEGYHQYSVCTRGNG